MRDEGGMAVAGFIRGILWGGVVACAGLAVVSEFAPDRIEVGGAASGGLEPSESSLSVAAEASAPEAVPNESPEPEITQAPLAADEVTPSAPEEPAPSATPSEATPPTTEPAPEGAAADAQMPAEAPEPLAVPQPDVVADAPEAVAEVAPDAGPMVPAVSAGSAPAATPPVQLDTLPAADAGVEAPPAPQEAPMVPQTDVPSTGFSASGSLDPVPPVSGATSGDSPMFNQPDAPATPVAEAQPKAAELPPAPPPSPAEEALLQPAPAPADVPELAPAAPVLRVDEGGKGLEDIADGVITNRLPRIGVKAPSEAVAETPAEASDYDRTMDETLPPLKRYARDFENPDQKPLFVILLEDNGEDVQRDVLAQSGLPLTVVIDPLSDGAAERAAVWRYGGQEVVLALSGVPEGATPGDIEQTMQILADKLPQSVGLIDPVGQAFQGDRQKSAQIVGILADQGRAVVSYDQGLNAADQVARREGVPSAVIFRRFDPEAATAPAVKRYLDRAVFKAAQEGQVVVIGSLRDDTIAGLMEWSIEGRAASVAIAPLTALFPE